MAILGENLGKTVQNLVFLCNAVGVKAFKGSVDRVQGGPNPPGDVHEDNHKTFLNRVGYPAISLNIWQHEA